jgi:hypothetical protein
MPRIALACRCGFISRARSAVSLGNPFGALLLEERRGCTAPGLSSFPMLADRARLAVEIAPATAPRRPSAPRSRWLTAAATTVPLIATVVTRSVLAPNHSTRQDPRSSPLERMPPGVADNPHCGWERIRSLRSRRSSSPTRRTARSPRSSRSPARWKASTSTPPGAARQEAVGSMHRWRRTVVFG